MRPISRAKRTVCIRLCLRWKAARRAFQGPFVRAEAGQGRWRRRRRGRRKTRTTERRGADTFCLRAGRVQSHPGIFFGVVNGKVSGRDERAAESVKGQNLQRYWMPRAWNRPQMWRKTTSWHLTMQLTNRAMAGKSAGRQALEDSRSRASRRARVPMMIFICSCRNNNHPTAIYPLGTFPRGIKKAHVMMLPSCPSWYYDDLFAPLVDVVVR